MSRPHLANPRSNIVLLRLTDAELEDLDVRRGGLTRSAYIRRQIDKARVDDDIEGNFRV